MHGSELIMNEIKLADDECCLVLDLGCYFPYSNKEILTFGFSFGEEKFDDYKINHRYPNKGYQTISKKYGRKVSKIGYPYIMKFDEQSPILFALKIGIKEQCMTLIFPILTKMTKDKPICGLSLHFLFDKAEFCFTSYEKAEDDGWFQHNWISHDTEKGLNDNDILLRAPHASGKNNTLIYDDVIEPFPSSLSDLLLL